jgi:cyclic pyranopterin phosphate synthase
MRSDKLTHISSDGKAQMIDISSKKDQLRKAKAIGKILCQPKTLELIKDNQIKKGDVLTVAQIAGIQSAKRTGELIPLCHTLPIMQIDVQLEIEKDGVKAECEVICIGKTGVEMEALTGASIALLTIYDMCKAVDKTMVISDVKLLSKVKTDL